MIFIHCVLNYPFFKQRRKKNLCQCNKSNGHIISTDKKKKRSCKINLCRIFDVNRRIKCDIYKTCVNHNNKIVCDFSIKHFVHFNKNKFY